MNNKGKRTSIKRKEKRKEGWKKYYIVNQI